MRACNFTIQECMSQHTFLTVVIILGQVCILLGKSYTDPPQLFSDKKCSDTMFKLPNARLVHIGYPFMKMIYDLKF